MTPDIQKLCEEAAELLALRAKATMSPWTDSSNKYATASIVCEGVPVALIQRGGAQGLRDKEFIKAAHRMADLIEKLSDAVRQEPSNDRPRPPPKCATCNDWGMIGGQYVIPGPDVDVWEAPCPDCTPAQEPGAGQPVAWRCNAGLRIGWAIYDQEEKRHELCNNCEPLYAHPPASTPSVPEGVLDAVSYAFDLLDRFNSVGGQGLREHEWIGLALQKLADAKTHLRSVPQPQSATPPPAAQSAWMPIATCPADGQVALFYRPLAEKSADQRIALKRCVGGNNSCWDVTIPKGELATNPTDGSCHATHWMPLPASPATPERQG